MPVPIDSQRAAKICREYQEGATITEVAQANGVSWGGARNALRRGGVGVREGGSGRPAVLDEQGQVRCRHCGLFKPPSEMLSYSAGNKLAGQPKTICRKCRYVEKRESPEYQENKRRYAYAAYRAMRDLADLHRPEFDALVSKYTDTASDMEIVAFQKVREHERAIYAVPDAQPQHTRRAG